METPKLATVEIKAFVPARDFELSKNFYAALGFEIPWSDEHLAYVHFGNTSFLLQSFYVEDHCKNFVMHLLVENVDEWWRHVQAKNIATEFSVKVGELKDQPWGMREFIIIDPSGVLWHVAQNTAPKP